MEVSVNGETVPLSEGATILDLLAVLELKDAKVAVELNQCIVPRSQHAEQLLHDGDSLEIVHAIGGG